MDALYFFRHSDHGDIELRYSLRGLAEHMPWLRKVWIFGDKPRFLADDQTIIEHVPHEYVARVADYRTPITNFFLMFYTSSLIPGLASEYVWLCDDFICINDVSPDVVTRMRCIEDMTRVKTRGRGLWTDSLWHTYDTLRRLGYPGFNFETHAPTFFTKRRVFEAWCDFQDFVTEDRWFGLLGPTAILNHACLVEDADVTYRADEGTWAGFYERPPNDDELREQTHGKCFLNFDDAAFGETISRFLEDRFSTPSHYERIDMIEDRNTQTSFRVAVPTDNSELAAYPKVIMKDRRELATVLNRRKLLGEGALVGVMNGAFAETLLQDWRGRRLHCIDGWLDARDDPRHIDKYNLPQWQIDHFYREAVRRLASFADRCHIHHARPDDMARFFDEGHLSFVYITEKHYFEAVWKLLETWAPKVQPGGILAGHNYLDGVLPSGHFEVKKAVDTWASQNGLRVECSGEPVWRSWIISIP